LTPFRKRVLREYLERQERNKRVRQLLASEENHEDSNTLRMRSFKLFKGPFPGFLTILTL